MPDEIDLSIIEIRLTALREALANAESDNVKLRQENSALRITACGAQEITQTLISKGFLTEFRSIWEIAPIEQLLEYMAALEKCLEVLSSIAALKRKTINLKRLKDRDAALVAEAEAYRKKSSPEGRHVDAVLTKAQRQRETAIKNMAKTLKCSYEKAVEHFDTMMAKAKKHD